MKKLRSMLQDSELIIGLTTQHVTSTWLAKLWKYSKCDFIYIEYEHGFSIRPSSPISSYRAATRDSLSLPRFRNAAAPTWRSCSSVV
jgi:hypothetical protein